MSATEPLATLKAALRWIERPLRTDARRNIAAYDLKGQRSLVARLRNTIARVEGEGR